MYLLQPRPTSPDHADWTGARATHRATCCEHPSRSEAKRVEAFELSRYMRPNIHANAPTVRSGLRTLTWLLLRALPLKELATVVDTVLMPTLSPPRSPIRALDEMCLFILDACEKMARCTCEPVVAGKDLRGVCTRIDLVFSYSIDATNCLFTD